MVGEGAAHAGRARVHGRDADAAGRRARPLSRHLRHQAPRSHARVRREYRPCSRRSAPGASLAVLTNKPRAATVRILNGLKLGQFFADDAIIGGDGLFRGNPIRPASRICAPAPASAPHETVMVGDSAVDWRTARACRHANLPGALRVRVPGVSPRGAARRRDPPRPPVRLARASRSAAASGPPVPAGLKACATTTTTTSDPAPPAASTRRRRRSSAARRLAPRRRTASAAVSRASTSTRSPGLRWLRSMNRRNAGS